MQHYGNNKEQVTFVVVGYLFRVVIIIYRLATTRRATVVCRSAAARNAGCWLRAAGRGCGPSAGRTASRRPPSPHSRSSSTPRPCTTSPSSASSAAGPNSNRRHPTHVTNNSAVNHISIKYLFELEIKRFIITSDTHLLDRTWANLLTRLVDEAAMRKAYLVVSQLLSPSADATFVLGDLADNGEHATTEQQIADTRQRFDAIFHPTPHSCPVYPVCQISHYNTFLNFNYLKIKIKLKN